MPFTSEVNTQFHCLTPDLERRGIKGVMPGG
jgi:hypothetical protein